VTGWLRAVLLACCAAAAASLARPSPAQPRDQAAPGRFIALSDIHFDPFASGMAPALADAEPNAWAAILNRAPPDYGRYGRDTRWSLLRGALDAMRAAEPEPAFLVLTGDLLAHRFRALFEASGIRDRGPGPYRAFVRKTVAFIAKEIARRFPGKPVFLALGNDDNDCGDYRLEPGGDFLYDTLPLVRSLVGAPDDRGFEREWLGGGGYALPNPALPGVRMVVLDSVFLSRNYFQACGPRREADPGEAALDWLERRLAESERAGEKVWLILHIPPGADAYATLLVGGCPDRLRPMWRTAYTRRFLALAARYASTIAAAYAGHTHMDEFRLLSQHGSASGFVLGTPGISPIFGQNPGFHVYAYGAAGVLQDRQTWYLANLPQAGDPAPPAWRREYAFRQFWDLPGLDLPSLEALDRRIGADPRTRAEWFSTYRVGRTAAWHVPGGADTLPPRVFGAYYCAIGHADPDAYRRCLCGAGPG
jgi:sphingomyelin phosphodiesterase acid-like 3